MNTLRQVVTSVLLLLPALALGYFFLGALC